MKKLLTFVLLTFALSAMPAGAAETLKIGVVSLERILREAAPAQRAEKKLEKEFSKASEELQKMAKQAKDMQTALDKDSVTLSEAERRNRERELASLNREFQRAQRQFREDLNLRRNEELAAVIERANKVIQSIAEAEKYDLVLQDVVYKSPRVDITEKVLKQLADK